MTINTFITAIVLLGEALFAFVVYLHRSRARANQFFGLLMLCTIAWVSSNFLTNYLTSSFWSNLTFTFAALIFYTLFLFVDRFPEGSSLSVPVPPVLRYGLHVVTWALIILITATRLVVNGVDISTEGLDPVLGPLYPVLLVYYAVAFVAATWILVKKHILATGEEERQLQYITIGLAVSIFFGLTMNVFIPLASGSYATSEFGHYGTLLFLIFAGVAILRHNLLNVTVIATEVFVGLLLFLLLGQFFFADTVTSRAGAAVVFVLALILSYFLIRSMLREVRQKEELGRLSDQLADANQQLKVLDEAKSEFVSIASHQLRTPLTVIKGYISMISEGSFGKIPTKQADPIRKIYESANRLIELVENLLSVSRIESGRMKYNFVPTRLDELAKSVVEEIRPAAENKKLKLTLEAPAKAIPELSLDAEKLRQVMMNLVDNAVKYTPKGSVKVAVEYAAGRPGTRITHPSVVFSVTDTGAGVGEAEQKQLFQKFNRGEGGKLNTRGTGLGLYVGRMMVEAHKGAIWVTSRGVGKGSTFAFAVPVPTRTDQAVLALKEMVG